MSKKTNELIDKKTGEITITRPRVKNPWVRERHLRIIEGESMTDQSEKHAADVNNIVAHFARTGGLMSSQITTKQGQYADVSELSGDPLELRNKYQEKMESLAQTEADLVAASNAAEEAAKIEEPPAAPSPSETPQD